MCFLIAVPSAGTACLESFGWTSIDIEVDAKVWPGIVAMEVGMSGDITWGQANERGDEVRVQRRRCYCGGLGRPASFLDLLLPLACRVELVPTKGRRKGLLTQIIE